MPAAIEDYALIGDCQTAALIERDGSMDWLCWPRFDSGACFAALLGTAQNGRWRIGPARPPARVRRRYRGDTLILETEFEDADGAVVLTDFMPLRSDSSSHVVRLLGGRRGRMAMRMELVLRFDYGTSVPWVTHLDDGQGIRAITGPQTVALRTTAPIEGRDLTTVAEFTIGAGETIPFVLSCCPANCGTPESIDPFDALRRTEMAWQNWSARCNYAGRWCDAVRRSLITLKALSFEPSGGIVAAATTSLPECSGGVRNWDYRFCWLRDATLTLAALMNAGYYDEARAWRRWLERAAAGSPAQMQTVYGVAGERLLPEVELDWLAGYRSARPVRVGNDAAGQLQIDVYGELISAMYQARVGGIEPDGVGWNMQRAMLDYLERIWREPDEGIWEVRGGRRHFTHSKIMAWVAFDAAIKAVEQFHLEGPVERWRRLRRQIHDDVCRNGFDSRRNAFVQSYGSSELDASLLLVPLEGFLPADDPRVKGTLAAIERELLVDGLVLRYRSESGVDALPPGEGVFLACSFWFADNLYLQGREAEAAELFERLLGLCNDVGLLAEEYDPRTRRFLGNFPQAFSHVGLIGTALMLSRQADPTAQPHGRRRCARNGAAQRPDGAVERRRA